MKLLVWLVLAVIVCLALRSKARSIRAGLRSGPDGMGARAGARSTMQKTSDAPAERMIDCAYCHIYLPVSDALKLASPSGNHYFCSEEHLRLHSGAARSQIKN